MSDPLRSQLLDLLEGKGAHAPFEDTVDNFPVELRGVKPHSAPHTAWQLLEHLRIALWDMIEFSRDPKHLSPEWPAGYWPKEEVPPSKEAWDKSVKAYQFHVEELKAMVRDAGRDLFTPFPDGSGKGLLRNALVIADHNAYHIGQLMYLRRMLGA